MKRIAILIVFLIVTVGMSGDSQSQSVQAVYDSALAESKAEIYKYIDGLAGYKEVPSRKAFKLYKMTNQFLKEKKRFDKGLEISLFPLTTVALDSSLMKGIEDYSDWKKGSYERNIIQYFDESGRLGVYLSGKLGHVVEVQAVFHQFGRCLLGLILAFIIGLGIFVTGAKKEEAIKWWSLIFIISLALSFFIVF